MKELYFVRHGQTEWNAVRRMQGQWNSNLNELGRQQAKTNADFLAGCSIEYMVASPLDRTRQTADLIDDRLKLGYQVDDRLKEWDCGDWSGEMWDTISDKWPAEFSAWQSDQFYYRGPGAENYPDMIARAQPFLSELMTTEFTKIAIVSHGMIGRVMIGTLLSMSPEEMLSFSQSNDTVIRVTVDDECYVPEYFMGGAGPHAGLPPRSY